MFRYFLVGFLCVCALGSVQAQDFSNCGDSGQSACEITGWADLHAMRTGLSKSYKLMADLSAATSDYATYAGPAANMGLGWLPIGEWESEFVGSFDGNGYRISDLTINHAFSEDSGDVFGLFGFVGKPQSAVQGVIQRVILEDINYRLFCDTTFGAPLLSLNSFSMGGLIGFKQASIEARQIEVSGQLELDLGDCSDLRFFMAEMGGVVGFHRGLLAEVYADLDISTVLPPGAGEDLDLFVVGGVSGFNQGVISGAAFTGTVTGPVAGGLTGFNDQELTDSYALAEVTGLRYTGGITGSNQGTFERVYFSGLVSGPSPDEGIAPLVGNMITGSSQASYWDQEIVGDLTDSQGSALDGTAMRTSTSFEGWDFSETGPWVIEAGPWISYPYLRAFDYDAPETSDPARAIPGLLANTLCPLGSFSETGYAPCQPCLAGTNTNEVGADVCRVEKVPTLRGATLVSLALLLALVGLIGLRRF